jgi:Protein tyrosine and serine/threonine kinase
MLVTRGREKGANFEEKLTLMNQYPRKEFSGLRGKAALSLLRVAMAARALPLLLLSALLLRADAQTVYVDNEDGAPTAVQSTPAYTVNNYQEATCNTFSGPGGAAGATRWCDNDDGTNAYEAEFSLPAGQALGVWAIHYWSVGQCGAGLNDAIPVIVDQAGGSGTVSTTANMRLATGWRPLTGGTGAQGNEYVMQGGAANSKIRWRGGSYVTGIGWSCVDGFRFVFVAPTTTAPPTTAPPTTAVPTTAPPTTAPPTTAPPTTAVPTTTASPATTTAVPNPTTNVPTTAVPTTGRTTGIFTTTGSTTGVVQSNPKATDEASSEAAPFPWWIIAVAAGACCCLLCLVVVLLVVRKRRSRKTEGSDFDAGDFAYELGPVADEFEVEDEENHYDKIAAVMAPTKEDNYQPATDVAEEQGYARLTNVTGVVEGSYAEFPKPEDGGQQHDAFSGVLVLDANDVLVDPGRAFAQGAFGAVYRGSYKGMDIAVKMLKPDFTEAQLESFYKEVEVIAKVPPHEFVVGFVGATPDPFLIATEFCGQGSLVRFLRSKRTASLTPNQELRILADIAEGMAHLASNKIVHRDLAARNVLLTNKLVPKICDFGMSIALEGDAHHSKSTVGPVRYMALEAIQKGRYSEKSDVWSFAVVAWEVFNRGSTPYGKDKPLMQVVREVMAGTRLQYPDGACSDKLSEFLGTCMLKDAGSRPKFADIVDFFAKGEDAGEVVYASLATFTTLDGGENGPDFGEFREDGF